MRYIIILFSILIVILIGKICMLRIENTSLNIKNIELKKQISELELKLKSASITIDTLDIYIKYLKNKMRNMKFNFDTTNVDTIAKELEKRLYMFDMLKEE